MKNQSIEGIVVKVTKQHIVLLRKGGVFTNVPRPEDEVPKLGQRYVYTQKKGNRFSFFKIVSIAAVFLLAFVTYGLFANTQAHAAYVVAIDINPKVEVYADAKLKVIKVKALDDDGERIKNSLEIKGHTLSDVVQQVIENCITQRFLPKKKEGLITTTIIPLSHDLKSINQEVRRAIQQPLQQHSMTAQIIVRNGSKQMLKKATEVGLSVNQFYFYNHQRRKGIPITLNSVRHQTLKQLKEKQDAAIQSRVLQGNHTQSETNTLHVNNGQKNNGQADQENKSGLDSASNTAKVQKAKHVGESTPSSQSTPIGKNTVSSTKQVKTRKSQHSRPNTQKNHSAENNHENNANRNEHASENEVQSHSTGQTPGKQGSDEQKVSRGNQSANEEHQKDNGAGLTVKNDHHVSSSSSDSSAKGVAGNGKGQSQKPTGR